MSEQITRWLTYDSLTMIDTFPILIDSVGIHHLIGYRDQKDNGLLHLLARAQKLEVLEHLVRHHNFNINEQRAKDLNTVLHIVLWYSTPPWDASDPRIDAFKSLGADLMLKNQYGEDFSDLLRLQTRVGQILKGKEAKEILSFLSEDPSDLHGMDAEEMLLVIQFLGKRVNRYPAHDRQNIFDDHRLTSLLQAFVVKMHFFCEHGASRVWVGLSEALLHFQHPLLIRTLHNLVFDGSFSLENLQAVALINFAGLISDCELARGWNWTTIADTLQLRLSELSIREVCLALKTFTKLGFHEGILRTSAEHLQGRSTEIPGDCLGTILWSYAKLGYCNPGFLSMMLPQVQEHLNRNALPAFKCAWAFARFAKLGFHDEQMSDVSTQLCMAAFQADELETQTAWSFAVLQVPNAQYYEACFVRYNREMYPGEPHWDHKTFATKFRQIHTVYQFVKIHCRDALNAMNTTLAATMAELDRLIRHGSETESVSALSYLPWLDIDYLAVRELDEFEF